MISEKGETGERIRRDESKNSRHIANGADTRGANTCLKNKNI